LLVAVATFFRRHTYTKSVIIGDQVVSSSKWGTGGFEAHDEFEFLGSREIDAGKTAFVRRTYALHTLASTSK